MVDVGVQLQIHNIIEDATTPPNLTHYRLKVVPAAPSCHVGRAASFEASLNCLLAIWAIQSRLPRSKPVDVAAYTENYFGNICSARIRLISRNGAAEQYCSDASKRSLNRNLS